MRLVGNKDTGNFNARTHMHINGEILTLTLTSRVSPSAALTGSAHRAQLFMGALKDKQATL